ncbi:related to aminopeptidase Y precursor, vacuolar [Rhynchosporium secalis]|uniref:Peptide hydrolase n=1 Tax=Rhynchosporium secalis TaxID=38038 RepID=A0A1E1M273_RHYSE|nr:related to aminopeptidase Y precursor, vacuolar [Rhynchosporium secalis]
MRFLSSFFVVAIAAAAGCIEASTLQERTGPKPVTSTLLQNAITEKALMKNLANLQKIASRNNNNRAFGYSGFAESVEFITDRLSKLSKTSSFYIQDFPALWTNVTSISLKIDGVDTYVFGLQYSPSTSSEGVTLPLVLGPNGTAACTADGYAGLNVTGKAVLVERGTCVGGGTLAGRVRAAVAAGAEIVIIYNNVDAHVTGGTLSAPDPVRYRPGGFIDRVDGLPVVARLLAGESVQVAFQQTQLIETKITQNIIAETRAGDGDNVVMLGAHLDSVVAGPGINDDGSGTSLILELFTALNKYSHNLKVRIAFWGAEENGLLGSRFYTSHLSTANASSLLTYLNFDMVSKGYFGVFDGDGSSFNLSGPPGSSTIEKLFVDDITSKGLTVTPAVWSGGSDYQSFFELGYPVGGLHTGTGAAQDPCYHQACDTYDNPNSTVLTVNAETAAHVLSILATEGNKLLPKRVVKRTPSLGEMEYPRSIAWGVEEGQHGHSITCGQVE